jgi:hypothetical protein
MPHGAVLLSTKASKRVRNYQGLQAMAPVFGMPQRTRIARQSISYGVFAAITVLSFSGNSHGKH